MAQETVYVCNVAEKPRVLSEDDRQFLENLKGELTDPLPVPSMNFEKEGDHED